MPVSTNSGGQTAATAAQVEVGVLHNATSNPVAPNSGSGSWGTSNPGRLDGAHRDLIDIDAQRRVEHLTWPKLDGLSRGHRITERKRRDPWFNT